ncbi:MAG: deoxyribodipyrimidine photolyase [Actinobacteria bacterium]|nr:deoxyribodipyrimidine photolyase [Actinomycetota bacterium]
MKQLDLTADFKDLIDREFAGLISDSARSSIQGGQRAADLALANLDITGYAKNRSVVAPVSRRGASMLSPYIRHNLITLSEAWNAVAKAPYADREKFRDELLWQEYARHLYARIGTRLFQNLRFEQNWNNEIAGWPAGMACTDSVLAELFESGWLVNQTRMWLASHWTVRNQAGWLLGQEKMYQHLIDGSRAANLLGWQWTVGAGTGKPYGFARWQVEKQAAGLCNSCTLKNNCPIQEFPAETVLPDAQFEPLLLADPDPAKTAGPAQPITYRSPEFVMLTIDSLGDNDAALVAHPELPAVFVFNAPALAKLQLSAKRIYFYLETLQDLATRRELQVYLGDPYEFADQNSVAITYAPVPSFKKFRDLAEIHPYPWLKQPHGKSVRSFSAWRGKIQ